MKTLLSVLCLLAASTLIVCADTARYETVLAVAEQVGGGWNGSNSVAIVKGEVGEVVSLDTVTQYGSVRVEKDGWSTPAVAANKQAGGVGSTAAGPAVFRLRAYNSGGVARMTVKITPESYDPNQTIIIAPTTNQVYVGLESSTNLVQWSTATNGIYGSPDEARFFRIHLQGQ